MSAWNDDHGSDDYRRSDDTGSAARHDDHQRHDYYYHHDSDDDHDARAAQLYAERGAGEQVGSVHGSREPDYEPVTCLGDHQLGRRLRVEWYLGSAHLRDPAGRPGR